jgi:plastocyanin
MRPNVFARIRITAALLFCGLMVIAWLAPVAAAQAQQTGTGSSQGAAPAQSNASAADNGAAASASPAQAPANDAAAKAAERKKRFEAQEKLLENSESAHAESADTETKSSPDDMAISPVLVNMLIGENQRFTLFDAAGHNLTNKAEWSLSNSYVADMSADGTPGITTKDAGTVTLHARVGSRSTDATIIVHSGTSLPIGTIRWQAPKVGNFKAQSIVQAVPTAQ